MGYTHLGWSMIFLFGLPFFFPILSSYVCIIICQKIIVLTIFIGTLHSIRALRLLIVYPLFLFCQPLTLTIGLSVFLAYCFGSFPFNLYPFSQQHHSLPTSSSHLNRIQSPLSCLSSTHIHTQYFTSLSLIHHLIHCSELTSHFPFAFIIPMSFIPSRETFSLSHHFEWIKCLDNNEQGFFIFLPVKVVHFGFFVLFAVSFYPKLI